MRELVIQLTEIKADTSEKLSEEFGSMEGLSNPALNAENQEFRVTYNPEYITAQIILDKLRGMGYEHADIRDEEI